MQELGEIHETSAFDHTNRCSHCGHRIIVRSNVVCSPWRKSLKAGIRFKNGKWEAWLGHKYLGRYTYRKGAEAARSTAIAIHPHSNP